LNEKEMISVIQTDMERKKADNILDELIKDEEFKRIFLKKLVEIKKK